MTYRVRLRGTPGQMIAEYLCADHGIFETIVARDDQGDPPELHDCPAGCPAARLLISAPRVRKMWKPVAAVRGGYEPPPSPYHQDLSAVADGRQTMGEWQEQRDRVWEDWRRDEAKKATS